MAQGDVTIFNHAKERIGNGDLALSGGSLKCALLTSAQAPAATDADPRLGGGSTPVYTQVAAGGNYAAGGAAMSTTITDNWTRSGGTCKLDGDDVSWGQHASNPTDARWGLIYVDNANDYAIGFVDLGSVFNMTTGDLTITWNASGIMTLT